MFSREYKIIKSEDDRFYLEEDAVIALANYIQKLEDLNTNYKAQISNLEEQIKNLKEMIELYEKKISALELEKKSLIEEIEKLRRQQIIWTVVAAITVGTVVYLFVK